LVFAETEYMNLLIALFFLALCVGQLGAIQVLSGLFIYFHDIVAVFLILATAVKVLRTKKFKKGIFLFPIGSFIALSSFSLLMNIGRLPWPDVWGGSLYLVRWILYASLYFVVLNTSTPKYWTKMLCIFGCVFSFLGLLQFVLYPQLANLSYLGWDPHYYRLFSTILDPNFASLIIGLTIILSTAYWHVWPLWATVAINGTLLTALVLTYSRSGFLSFVVSGIAYMFLTKRYKMVILFGAFVALFAFIPRSPLDVTSMFRKTSSLARVHNLQVSWELAMRSPVIGFGFNTIKSLQLKPMGTEAPTIMSRAGAGIDNSFLFLLATVGFAGAAIYCWLVYRMISVGNLVTRKKKDGKTMAIVLISTLVAVVIHSNFNNSLFYAWTMIWIWVLVGAVERYL
jgi:hypothetical protein